MDDVRIRLQEEGRLIEKSGIDGNITFLFSEKVDGNIISQFPLGGLFRERAFITGDREGSLREMSVNSEEGDIDVLKASELHP